MASEFVRGGSTSDQRTGIAELCRRYHVRRRGGSSSAPLPAPIGFPAMPVPVVWHRAYEVDIGPHVFPTRKYRLVRDPLLAEGTITDAREGAPAPAAGANRALVPHAGYLRSEKDPAELPLRSDIVCRALAYKKKKD